MEAIAIIALLSFIWWIYDQVGPMVRYLLGDPIDQMGTPQGEQHDSKLVGPERLDLDDETGYCDFCGRVSPSRAGQCVTCGSVVHVG